MFLDQKQLAMFPWQQNCAQAQDMQQNIADAATTIPTNIKEWLTKKGIQYFEWL
jgi:hypothetical protein